MQMRANIINLFEISAIVSLAKTRRTQRSEIFACCPTEIYIFEINIIIS